MSLSLSGGSPWYSVLLVVGILIGVIGWSREARKDSRIPMIYAAGIAGAFLGAKLAFLIAEGWMFVGHPDRVRILLSGKSIMGGLPGGWIGVEVAKKVLGYEKATGDRFALMLPVSLTLGRMGCLAAGCCKGIPCRFGIWPSVEVEIVFQLVSLGVLLGLRARDRAVGQHFHLYLMGYGTFRFVHEFLRATPKPFLGISGYQIIAVVTALAAFVAYRRRARASINVG